MPKHKFDIPMTTTEKVLFWFCVVLGVVGTILTYGS